MAHPEVGSKRAQALRLGEGDDDGLDAEFAPSVLLLKMLENTLRPPI